MRRTLVAVATVLGLTSPVTSATITALNDASFVGNAPTEVANSQFGNNDGISIGFNEASGLIFDTDKTFGGSVINAGTAIDSHLLYHDRFSGSDFITSFNAFHFSEMIVAVIVDTAELNATHGIFGPDGTIYKSAYGFFGLEEDERNEIVVTSNEVFARFTVNNGFDAVRVLTLAEVPLPSAGLLLIGALGGLAFRGRRHADRRA